MTKFFICTNQDDSLDVEKQTVSSAPIKMFPLILKTKGLQK